VCSVPAALTADGRVVCWGNSTYGQTNSPAGLTNAVAVAAGTLHTAALTADGRVVCWGNNGNGQTDAPTALTNAAVVGCGSNHTLARTATGEIVCWGDNSAGQSESFFPCLPVRYLDGGTYYSLALVGYQPLFTDSLDSDSDDDTLPDGWEVNYGFDPLTFQTDGIHGLNDDPDDDGLTNIWEGMYGTNPFDGDTDGDTLSDAWEILYAGDGVDPFVPGDPSADPDADGLSNAGESVLGTNPFAADTDGDGLTDAAETPLGTNPLDADTDDDGMSDGWETGHDGFNPLAVQTDGTHGADNDPDVDGLNNLRESQSGTDPLSDDTDGDGLTDGVEVDEHGTSPLNSDTDGDGLDDPGEIAMKTTYPCLDPLNFDSDGDMLPDGWEVQCGLGPCECAVTNSPVWDADGDGLGLFDEYRHCTDIGDPDTDGDGILDGDEVPHSPGSCPNDADDGGDPANCVTLRFTVGDPSESNSERWALEVIEDVTGKAVVRHSDQDFGTPGSAEYALVKGKTYTFRLRWIATNREYGPDYDWQAKINDSIETGVRGGLYGTGAFIVEDPDGLLTEYTDGGDNNLTLDREGRIIVPKIVTETVAEQPPDRTRKTIGVGEVVNLTLAPGLSSTITATWTRVGDGDLRDTTGVENLFIAPDRNATTTITANFGSGASCSRVFQTIEPSDILFENFYIDEVTSVAPPTAKYLCVRYGANVYFRPASVNFGKITVIEGFAATQTEPGCFRDYPPPHHGEWATPRSLVSDGSTWVEGKGTCPDWDEGDNITGLTQDVTQYPLRDGYAWWDIGWLFKIGTGDFKTFRIVCQDYRVTGTGTNGTLRVTKKSSGAEISTGEATAHFITP